MWNPFKQPAKAAAHRIPPNQRLTDGFPIRTKAEPIGPWPPPPPPGPGAILDDGTLAAAVLAGWAPGQVQLSHPVDDPAAIMAAARKAQEAGAAWLALPLAAHHDGEPPLALRLTELDTALQAWRLPPIHAPLLRCSWRELGRLAVAYGVDLTQTRDCPTACGACPACKGRAQAFAAAGLPRA
jgi:hypothetical protein